MPEKRINDVIVEEGAVTFLDVLGWKGIWERNQSAINSLSAFVIEMQKKAEEITEKYSEDISLRGKSNATKVLSISDTIAVFTSASPKISIKIHSELCSWAIPAALKNELPLRGAISYGEYSISNNIMLGYAVDESASWHETTDWIGVILTPSAKILLENNENNESEYIVKYDNIPFKKKMPTLNLCVKWKYEDKTSLYSIIKKKGPHVPEIAPKYLNTLNYLDFIDNS